MSSRWKAKVYLSCLVPVSFWCVVQWGKQGARRSRQLQFLNRKVCLLNSLKSCNSLFFLHHPFYCWICALFSLLQLPSLLFFFPSYLRPQIKRFIRALFFLLHLPSFLFFFPHHNHGPEERQKKSTSNNVCHSRIRFWKAMALCCRIRQLPWGAWVHAADSQRHHPIMAWRRVIPIWTRVSREHPYVITTCSLYLGDAIKRWGNSHWKTYDLTEHTTWRPSLEKKFTFNIGLMALPSVCVSVLLLVLCGCFCCML